MPSALPGSLQNADSLPIKYAVNEGDTMNFDTVGNYYEQHVYRQIVNMLGEEYVDDPDFLADVACVTLNSLPPRYIRHHVDMAFFMTGEEREAMEKSINDAITDAVEFVQNRQRSESD